MFDYRLFDYCLFDYRYIMEAIYGNYVGFSVKFSKFGHKEGYLKPISKTTISRSPKKGFFKIKCDENENEISIPQRLIHGFSERSEKDPSWGWSYHIEECSNFAPLQATFQIVRRNVDFFPYIVNPHVYYYLYKEEEMDDVNNTMKRYTLCNPGIRYEITRSEYMVREDFKKLNHEKFPYYIHSIIYYTSSMEIVRDFLSYLDCADDEDKVSVYVKALSCFKDTPFWDFIVNHFRTIVQRIMNYTYLDENMFNNMIYAYAHAYYWSIIDKENVADFIKYFSDWGPPLVSVPVLKQLTEVLANIPEYYRNCNLR